MLDWLLPTLDSLPVPHRIFVFWVIILALGVSPVVLRFLRVLAGISETRRMRIDRQVDNLINNLQKEIERIKIERQQKEDECRRLIDQLQIMQTAVNSLEEEKEELEKKLDELVRKQYIGS